MTEILIIGAVGIGSYALRVSFIAVVGSRAVPASINRLLDYLRPAVFSALGVTALLHHQGTGPEHLAALVAAGVVARHRSDLLGVLITGMTVLMGLRLVL